jgi:hypothetical protein
MSSGTSQRQATGLTQKLDISWLAFKALYYNGDILPPLLTMLDRAPKIDRLANQQVAISFASSPSFI